jgi:hypothetical protein
MQQQELRADSAAQGLIVFNDLLPIVGTTG